MKKNFLYFCLNSLSVTKLENFFHNYYVKIRDHVDKKIPISEQERICHELVIKVLKLQNTNLSISPISNKRIISNELKNLYIILNGREIHVLNNSHGYIVYMENDDFFQEIVEIFNQILESKNLEMEKELQKNIVYSLSTILSELNT